MHSSRCPHCKSSLRWRHFALRAGWALGYKQGNVVQCPHCKSLLGFDSALPPNLQANRAARKPPLPASSAFRAPAVGHRECDEN